VESLGSSKDSKTNPVSSFGSESYQALEHDEDMKFRISISRGPSQGISVASCRGISKEEGIVQLFHLPNSIEDVQNVPRGGEILL
jgi:hypothetical protein